MNCTAQEIETELRKRLEYPYVWGGLQNDSIDTRTNFIYRILDFDDLLVQTRIKFENGQDYQAIRNYTLNRWYNFWSAKAVEESFCLLNRVEPAKNSKDRLVDYSGLRTRAGKSLERFGFGPVSEWVIATTVWPASAGD